MDCEWSLVTTDDVSKRRQDMIGTIVDNYVWDGEYWRELGPKVLNPKLNGELLRKAS